jgi:hypothetical protein
MSRDANVWVTSQCGIVAILTARARHIEATQLTATEAERVGYALIAAAAEIKRHPLYETLPEDQR